jgi:uncharacterized protein (TIGR02646 family)
MIRLERPACPDTDALANGNYKFPANKEALRRASHGKCMYCETYIESSQYGDVEHIFPKAAFPELEFVWSNLGFACTICNNKKNDGFDTDNPFIDPYEDEPPDFLEAYGGNILARDGNTRARYTVNVIDLNRAQLVGKRNERISQLLKIVDLIAVEQNAQLKQRAIDAVANEVSPDKEHSFVAKIALRALLEKSALPVPASLG